MRKKSNQVFDDFINQEKVTLCDQKDCMELGYYEAPKSPNSNEKYFFCLQHIKLYNKRWNFFAGKSQKQIYDYQKNDFFEGRPTSPFANGSTSNIKFEFDYKFNKEKIKFDKKNKKFKKSHPTLDNKEIEKALMLFSIKYDFNEKNLKKRYKELVKKYHPDLNKNLLNKDSKIKEINKSYNFLLKVLKNKNEVK